MCEKAVRRKPCLLKYVPDWFVKQQQLKLWHDDHDYYNNDKFIECCDGYKKRKAQKAQIKIGLLPIT